MAFFATSLILSIIAGMDRKPRSILDGTAHAGPAGSGRAGRADCAAGRRPARYLARSAERAGGAPAPPSGPQVPQSR